MGQRQLIAIEMDVLARTTRWRPTTRTLRRPPTSLLNLVSSRVRARPPCCAETLCRLGRSVLRGDRRGSADQCRCGSHPCHRRPCRADQHRQGLPSGRQNGSRRLPPAARQSRGILFIENVGNLVCPPSFDLGEKYKVAILSVTEGKSPLKYPDMFAAAQLMVINKLICCPMSALTWPAASRTPNGQPYIQVIRSAPPRGRDGCLAELVGHGLNQNRLPKPEPEPETARLATVTSGGKGLMPPSYLQTFTFFSLYRMASLILASPHPWPSPQGEGTGLWMPRLYDALNPPQGLRA